MANIIKPKRTEDTGKIPTTSDIESGELAVNIADARLFIRDSASNIVELAPAQTDYVSDTGGTFTGNVSVNGTLTAAADFVASNSATFDGTSIFNGSIVATGNVILGDTAADTITLNGSVSGLELTDVDGIATFGTVGQVLTSDGDGTFSWGDAAVSTHTHPISDIVNLQNELNDRALNTHTHTLVALGITEGNDGEVLTTDGAGVYTWEATASGNVFYFVDGGNASNIYAPDEPDLDAGGA